MEKEPSPLMTDEDVAKLLRASMRTFRKRIKDGPPAGEIDIRKAEPQKFGGRRFWLRRKVEAVLGIKEDRKQ